MTEETSIPKVGDHELLRMIGRGGGGEVWLARNMFGTLRAAKIVRENRFANRTAYQRELNGILKFEPVSRLHDGLVDILQVGKNEAEGYFYYVMELADDNVCGQASRADTYVPRTLEADKKRLGRLPVAECVRLGAAIASALGFLHKNNLIHRDIKPANIIFVNGIPKLADIGLVTDIAESSFVGTDGFIPAEGSGSVRADIYSLGKVLYEISTGNDRHEYPELPEPLDESAESRDLLLLNKIILKACRTKPWHRYQAAEEMMMALLAFEFDKNALQRQEHRRLLTRAAIVAGILVTMAVVGTLLWRLAWLLSR